MRLSISRHDHPHQHLDCFFAVGDAATPRERPLITFRASGAQLDALAWPGIDERIGDHREVYLDYEGAVSGGRGRVQPIATGEYTLLEGDPQSDSGFTAWIELAQRGGVAGERVRGRLVVWRGASGRWRSHFTPPGGLFVALEGIDGCGKSTLARSLVATLAANGKTTWLSREPSDAGFGAVVRQRLAPRAWQDPLALALGFAADRAEHVHAPDGILARRARKEVVILDRYRLSSLVYQAQVGLAGAFIFGLNAEFPAPDVTFLIDLDVDVALRRLQEAAGRGDDLYERRAFLAGVRERYLHAASVDPAIVVLDGSLSPAELVGLAQPVIVAALARGSRIGQ